MFADMACVSVSHKLRVFVCGYGMCASVMWMERCTSQALHHFLLQRATTS